MAKKKPVGDDSKFLEQLEKLGTRKGGKEGKKIDRPIVVDPDRPLSTAIRRALSESGLSTYEIAAKAEITPPAIYRFMTGERGLSQEALDKVCRVVGLEISVRPSKQEKKAAGF